jgi:hypothetical protein
MRAQAEVALKEWAVVCAALAAGRHGILLRKGGIREAAPDRRFHLEHRAFALLPTYFHAHDPARARDLVPAAAAELPALAAAAPPPGTLRVDLYAEVAARWHVRDPARLRALVGRHPLSDACVAERFAYREPGLWVLFLRTWRLRQPVTFPDRPGYAGCVSWVHLDAPVAGEADPARSDDAHAQEAAALAEVLGEEAAA